MPENTDHPPKIVHHCCSREEKQSQRQAEIVEKAIELFAKHGYADTDTQLLADELCVGKGTIYRYFGSKEELFLAAVDCGVRKLREGMEPILSSALDPLEKVRCGIRNYLNFFLEHREIVELFIQERALFKDRRKPTYFQHREHYVKRWQAVYGQLMDEGRVRRMAPERITDIVGDLIWGTMFTNYFSGRASDAATQAEAILDIVCLGILQGEQRCTWLAQSGGEATVQSDDITAITPETNSSGGNDTKPRRSTKIRKA